MKRIGTAPLRTAANRKALVRLPGMAILCLSLMSTFGSAHDAIAGNPEPRVRMTFLPDDTLRVGITPAEVVVDPGDTFLVEIAILEEGPEFNGYDALVGYDPTRLTFLQMNPLSDQEGPLMTEACPNRFHIFNVSQDSTILTVNHVLLCSEVTMTGPGVVYRLQFQCKEQTGPTELQLLAGTQFYDAGIFVNPLLTYDAQIVIGVVSPAPEVAPHFRIPLRAHPNPFNPSTVITFELPGTRRTELGIFALDGRLVRTLVSGVLSGGSHSYSWDGCDRNGRSLPSGSYAVFIQTEDQTATHSVTLIK